MRFGAALTVAPPLKIELPLFTAGSYFFFCPYCCFPEAFLNFSPLWPPFPPPRYPPEFNQAPSRYSITISFHVEYSRGGFAPLLTAMSFLFFPTVCATFFYFPLLLGLLSSSLFFPTVVREIRTISHKILVEPFPNPSTFSTFFPQSPVGSLLICPSPPPIACGSNISDS